MQNGKNQFKGISMLFLTAFIWGMSFVAQSAGMEKVGGFTFNSLRTLLGAVVLFPIVIIRDKAEYKKMTADQIKEKKKADRKTAVNGIILGIVFFAASNFQQFAFNYSTAGKIAFITALYIFFVPLFGLFLKRNIPLLTWICIFIGITGLYFLCINPHDSGVINKGDILSIICAAFFAVHILLIEKFSPDVDGIKLSCIQFAVSGTITFILMLIFEFPQAEAVKSAALPLLYSGIMSCGVAYTFQIIGQKYTTSTTASLIMCTESVFAVISAAVLLNDLLTLREIFGCSLMFIAIIVSQISEARRSEVQSVPHRS